MISCTHEIIRRQQTHGAARPSYSTFNSLLIKYIELESSSRERAKRLVCWIGGRQRKGNLPRNPVTSNCHIVTLILMTCDMQSWHVVATLLWRHSICWLMFMQQHHHLQIMQIMLSRKINTRGHQGHNIPVDLHMEHFNWCLKDNITGLRANIMETTVVQSSRSLKGLLMFAVTLMKGAWCDSRVHSPN